VRSQEAIKVMFEATKVMGNVNFLEFFDMGAKLISVSEFLLE
jgi:hypothetical protein